MDRVKGRHPLSLRGLKAALLLGGLAAWWLVYRNLEAFARWLVHDLLSMAADSRLTSALEFFVYEAPKVLMLLFVVVFGVGIVRSFFTPERTRRMLAGRRQTVGNALAALLGVVTPFCSCSAVPLFIGFVTTGIPLGVTFSFLISAPMVNEVALVLLFGLFGWKVAALYLGTGLAIAMIAGWTIGRLHLEKWVEGWVYQTKTGVGPDTAPLSGRTGFGPAATRSRTSWARSGLMCWPASRWAQASTAMCPRTSWPRSWARARGGRYRWRS